MHKNFNFNLKFLNYRKAFKAFIYIYIYNLFYKKYLTRNTVCFYISKALLKN